MCSQDYLKLLLALPLNYCVVSCAFVSLSIKCVYGNVASFFFPLSFSFKSQISTLGQAKN